MIRSNVAVEARTPRRLAEKLYVVKWRGLSQTERAAIRARPGKVAAHLPKDLARALYVLLRKDPEAAPHLPPGDPAYDKLRFLERHKARILARRRKTADEMESVAVRGA